VNPLVHCRLSGSQRPREKENEH